MGQRQENEFRARLHNGGDFRFIKGPSLQPRAPEETRVNLADRFSGVLPRGQANQVDPLVIGQEGKKLFADVTTGTDHRCFNPFHAGNFNQPDGLLPIPKSGRPQAGFKSIRRAWRVAVSYMAKVA